MCLNITQLSIVCLLLFLQISASISKENCVPAKGAENPHFNNPRMYLDEESSFVTFFSLSSRAYTSPPTIVKVRITLSSIPVMPCVFIHCPHIPQWKHNILP